MNHTADVRISTGEVLNPKAYPRQSVEADWWHWKPNFKFKWAHKENININILELRSILQAVLYSISHKDISETRFFHLSDSYVCISIIGKGRSGSRLLNKTLKVLNAFFYSWNHLNTGTCGFCWKSYRLCEQGNGRM